MGDFTASLTVIVDSMTRVVALAGWTPGRWRCGTCA